MPWRGLSLILVGCKTAAPDGATDSGAETNAILSKQTA